MRCSRGLAAAAVVGALLAVGTEAGAASTAEMRRMESVGVAALAGGKPSRVPPRDRAVRTALADAVRRVAIDLLGPAAVAAAEAPPDSPEALEMNALLGDALGSDPLKYTTRFRILEDRGERPALFIEDPEVVTEYVIVLESHVDVGRVHESLARSGLVAVPSGDASRVRMRVVVEMVDGAQGYGAYAALREALLGVRGVHSALPVELERGRAILEVEAERETRALLDELLESLPPGLAVTPLFTEAESLTLRIQRTAVAPASGAIDTRTRKRY